MTRRDLFSRLVALAALPLVWRKPKTVGKSVEAGTYIKCDCPGKIRWIKIPGQITCPYVVRDYGDRLEITMYPELAKEAHRRVVDYCTRPIA